jgi:hypothetical protein
MNSMALRPEPLAGGGNFWGLSLHPLCASVSLGGRPMCCPRATARLRPSAVRVRIRSRSTSANPPSTAIMRRPVLVAVSAHGSASDRNCPPASTICLTMANRSKVERAKRSIRVTVTTSPRDTAFSIRRSSRRSAFAPLALPAGSPTPARAAHVRVTLRPASVPCCWRKPVTLALSR